MFPEHNSPSNIIPSNLASLNLASRAGFRKEGLAPRMIEINGKWQDHTMWAKLTDEHRPVYIKP